MDFVVGLSKTLVKFDYIWVIIDSLTKSAHFIPFQVTYNNREVDQDLSLGDYSVA